MAVLAEEVSPEAEVAAVGKRRIEEHSYLKRAFLYLNHFLAQINIENKPGAMIIPEKAKNLIRYLIQIS